MMLSANSGDSRHDTIILFLLLPCHDSFTLLLRQENAKGHHAECRHMISPASSYLDAPEMCDFFSLPSKGHTLKFPRQREAGLRAIIIADISRRDEGYYPLASFIKMVSSRRHFATTADDDSAPPRSLCLYQRHAFISPFSTIYILAAR